MSGDITLPYSLPGEQIRASVTGKIGRPLEITDASSERQSPECQHFGLPGDGCGGCHLQHMGRENSLDFKFKKLVSALSAAGVTTPRPQIHQSSPQSRRRAGLSMIRTGKGWRAGFRQWRCHHVVNMTECRLLVPEMTKVVLAFQKAVEACVTSDTKSLELFLTYTDTGLDFDISGIEEARLDLPQREALAGFAAKHDLARLTLDDVPLAMARRPQMSFGDVMVDVPAKTFLQATQDGQDFLTKHVLSGVGEARQIGDLFCGLGTFALPLSQSAHVTAIDMDGPALEALKAAARKSHRSVTAEKRDLFDYPLSPEELKGFDAIVIDPPRAGAEAQYHSLSESQVPKVIAVSCDIRTFVRDISLLSENYGIISLAILDQFLWSPHVEMLAVLDRKITVV